MNEFVLYFIGTMIICAIGIIGLIFCGYYLGYKNALEKYVVPSKKRNDEVTKVTFIDAD